MGVKDEIGRVEYHYGFYGAIHVQYEPTHVRMEYRQEYELGSEPVRMDMLILKHDQTPLTDPIGRFFKKIMFWSINHRWIPCRLTISIKHRAMRFFTRGWAGQWMKSLWRN